MSGEVSEATVLHRALAVLADRVDTYGDGLQTQHRTAALWSAVLGIPVTARQVCLLNILQKVSRDAHREGTDNLVDIAGYAQLAHTISAL